LSGKWLGAAIGRAEKVWEQVHAVSMAQTEQRAAELLPDDTPVPEAQPQEPVDTSMAQTDLDLPFEESADPLSAAIKRRRSGK